MASVNKEWRIVSGLRPLLTIFTKNERLKSFNILVSCFKWYCVCNVYNGDYGTEHVLLSCLDTWLLQFDKYYLQKFPSNRYYNHCLIVVVLSFFKCFWPRFYGIFHIIVGFSYQQLFFIYLLQKYFARFVEYYGSEKSVIANVSKQLFIIDIKWRSLIANCRGYSR